MDIDSFVDEISMKFGYSNTLKNDLKRILPLMLEGKDEAKQKMLFNTLEQVKIFVLPERATVGDLEECKREVFGGSNEGVTFSEADLGEYSSVEFPAGAYISEPVFDDDMNIVGRNRMLYVKEISEYSGMREVYGSSINLSHLIHELGHAWAAEKDEYVQNPDGSFVQNVGAGRIVNHVDRDDKQVTGVSSEGIFVEESLNTIQEENVLLALTGAESIRELSAKGYVMSSYQGLQTDVMKAYVEKFGMQTFEEYRYSKDPNDLREVEQALSETEAWHTLMTEEYTQRKKEKMLKVDDLEASEEAKSRIKGAFQEYSDVFFADNSKFTPIGKLDNVLEQLYNFGTVKYNFNIMSSTNNMEIYKEVVTAIAAEGYALKTQARDLTRQEPEQKGFMGQLQAGVQDEKNVSQYYISQGTSPRNVEEKDKSEI